MQLTVTGASTAKKVTLSDDVFALPLNKALLTQAVRTQLSNRRTANAHAKTRGDVSGGGRKPWRQKGTGRARVGSSRTPLWRGGGVIFGPTSERSFALKMPAKMAKQAFRHALSLKASEKKLVVVADFSMDSPSTKNLIKTVAGWGVEYRRAVIVIPKKNDPIRLSARNAVDLETRVVSGLTTYDVLSTETLFVTESALQLLQKGAKATPKAAAAPKAPKAKAEEAK
jgi:large subunit ribosomal protein L4